MDIAPLDGHLPAGTPFTPAGAPRSAASPAQPPAERLPENVATPSDQLTHQAAQQFQARLREAGSDLSFSIDKETGKTVVKLIDPATQQVIRQIPSQEMMDIAHNLDKAIQGLLISQKV